MGRLSAFFKSAAGITQRAWRPQGVHGEPVRCARLTVRNQEEVRASDAAPWFSPGSSAPCERIAAISSAGVIS
ncbi:hypothetical protein DI458_33950 [Burkholderia contaminans]|nr:hypothetical protein [Burkholderia contaminans]MBA9839632.1 hypothetical protein [Burkholderia contaminans]MBA9862704.1 hypothetical protein [Burkholderia contaminans]MBA9905748.1 hypothetical protein [Burkholderia contaminans]MBA9930039.1 hypothetical protein [Burkholderia contaminans]